MPNTFSIQKHQHFPILVWWGCDFVLKQQGAAECRNCFGYIFKNRIKRKCRREETKRLNLRSTRPKHKWTCRCWSSEFLVLWPEIMNKVFLSRLCWALMSVYGPEGTDSEPRVDFRLDESSDVPILEDRSSSPIDFPQEQWLVGNDIENIERYTHRTCSFCPLWKCFTITNPYCVQNNWSCSLNTALFVCVQRYARDAKPTQQTQGDDAIATEKSRCVKTK